MNEKERWENPNQRAIIQKAVLDTLQRGDETAIRSILWAASGAPWEAWTLEQIDILRIKLFFERVPRFI